MAGIVSESLSEYLPSCSLLFRLVPLLAAESRQLSGNSEASTIESEFRYRGLMKYGLDVETDFSAWKVTA